MEDLGEEFELTLEKEEIETTTKTKPIPKLNYQKTVKHSYACKVLADNNFKIIMDGKQILSQGYPFNAEPLTTFINIGEQFARDFISEEIEVITNYHHLNKLGWKISAIQAPGEFFQYQQVKYFLTPLHSTNPDYMKMPEKHYVDLDKKNQLIRFVGQNVSKLGFTEWIHLDGNKNQIKLEEKKLSPFDLKGVRKASVKYFQDRIPDELKNKQEQETKQIPEVVIGFTEMGEVCCMPFKPKDAPVIAISGARGCGKSILENTLECGFYGKYDYDIFNINDIKGDTQTRCVKWDETDPFYKDLQRFNEPTFPMPYVYLHPVINDLTEEDILYENEVGFKISLPFKDLITDPNLIKYNKQWNLSEESKKYIHNSIYDDDGKERKNGLLSAKSLSDVNNVLDEFLPQKMANLKLSIFNVIKNIWNKNILDITSGIKDRWTLQDQEKEVIYPSWDVCLKARLVPSFITSYIRNEPYFAIWIKHILEDVFKFVKTSGYNRYLMLCGDELVSILREKSTRAIIDQVIREGRTDRIGFIQVVQFRKDIPPSIIANVTHNFIFKTNTTTDLTLIRKDISDIDDTQINEIGKLKTFQCFCFGDFILYDSNGNRYSNKGEPVKIVKVKPPNAQHWGGR